VGRDPNGLVQENEVRPHAPLGRLREVFVVVDVERLAPWGAAGADSAPAGPRAPTGSAMAPAVAAPDSVRAPGGGPR
jgi:hypothetical protein